MDSWPHAPSKLVTAPGTYFVTSSTLQKVHLFDSAEKLRMLQSVIFETCEEFKVELQAWAIFSNHYHLVGFAPQEKGVQKLNHKIHGVSARNLNILDDSEGRKVWFQMRDTRLTFEKSYLARLNYVHNNPSKHGFGSPLIYPFCSAHWFETQGDRSFVETVKSFKFDQLDIDDDF
ncbi:MAG: transposase [Armatimonadota bacterium]